MLVSDGKFCLWLRPRRFLIFFFESARDSCVGARWQILSLATTTWATFMQSSLSQIIKQPTEKVSRWCQFRGMQK